MGQPGQRAAWVRHQSGGVADAATQLPRLVEEARPRLSSRLASAQLTPEAREVLRAIEEDAQARIAAVEAEAAAAIAAAHEQVEQWRAYAQASEAEARQRGYDAGFAEAQPRGFQAGEAAARSLMYDDISRINAMAEACVIEMRDALQAAQTDLAALSLEIARAIIGEALRADADLISRRVALLVNEIADQSSATVRVNPADLALAQAHWPVTLRSRRATDQGPRLIGDERVTPGGCAIESRSQYLDGQWDVLIAAVRAAFDRVPQSDENEHTPTAQEEAA